MTDTAFTIEEWRRAAATGAFDKGSPKLRLATSGSPEVTAESRTVRFVFSDGSVDRYGDTVDPAGWDLRAFMANPVALFGHDASDPANVIGRASNLSVRDGKLLGDIEFVPAEVNPVAETVFQMVKGGFLNAVSVGFLPVEWQMAKDKTRQGGIDFKRQELLEISVVPIPANSNALAQARAAGIDVSRLGLEAAASRAPVQVKSLYHVSWLAELLASLGCLAESAAWEAEREGDGSAVPQELTDAVHALGQALIAMTVEEVTELLGSGDPDEDLLPDEPGAIEMATQQSTRARAFRLLRRLDPGALAGIDAAMRHHLAGHRVTFSVAGKSARPLGKAGRVLSAANEKTLRDAHEMMTKGAGMVIEVCNQVGEIAEEKSASPAVAGAEPTAAEIEAETRRRIAEAAELSRTLQD